MATLIKVDGTETEVTPKDPATGFALQELYDLLHIEMVEVIHTDDGHILALDEDGKTRQDHTVNHTGARDSTFLVALNKPWAVDSRRVGCP